MARQNLSKKEEAKELVLTRVFNAPREMVWHAWTDPKQVAKWWGPTGFTTTIEEMDVRPGGAWRQVMHGPDGTDYPNESVFREVVKPERIVFSHGGGRKGGAKAQFEATWTFEALEDGKTRVTICMVFPTAADLERVVKEYGAVEGGNQTLGRLGEHLVNAPVIVERTFSAPVETVWKALTDKDQMKKWFFDVSEFRPEPGFAFQFYGQKCEVKYLHHCKVIEAVRNKKLSYSWRYEGYEGSSLVTIELFPEGKKTRLRLAHEGVTSHTNCPRNDFFNGWTHIIGTSLQGFMDKAT